MPSREFSDMKKLKEKPFTLQYVVPLFKNRGFIGVAYTGGNEECGRDVWFYDIGRFGNRKDMAAQVKVGDIRGTYKVQEIASQAVSAYTNPFIDLYTMEERMICELWVITSGSITTNAKTQLRNRLKILHAPIQRFIHFMDGREVFDETCRTHVEMLEYSLWEDRMSQLGLVTLLNDDEDFRKHVNASLELLFNDKRASPLQVVYELPKVLLAFPKLRRNLQTLGTRERDVILHWFSISIMTQAYLTYGRIGIFVLE